MSASLSIPGVQGVLYSSGLSNPVKSQFTTLKSQCEKQSACATGIGSNAAFIISVRQPKRLLIRRKVAENASSAKKKSILCNNCEGNGMVQCSQCKGSGVNSVDHFNGQFKAGATCWLCRGKKEMLCGDCNGAGFVGGFMTTPDE